MVTTPNDDLIRVEDLKVDFTTGRGVIRAVNGLTFSLRRGETLVLIGESGSGKSVSALALMGLLKRARVGGQIWFDGMDLLTESTETRRRLRGKRISMIFQDALAALNPVHTVGWQIAEMFVVHRGASRTSANREAVELLQRVRIPRASARFNDYPHQLSGGMRQRVMIAMAIALSPDVLIADEPTTALDVTVQAQIMDLLQELRSERGMSLLLITHDMAVASEMADRIGVMYAGRMIESAPSDDLMREPLHPYTEGLLRSILPIDGGSQALWSIPGEPPDAVALPHGCSFHPRCTRAREACRIEVPPLIAPRPGRSTRCLFYSELEYEGGRV
jgi:oligopeptide transport system ATP-binding protein